MTVYTDLATWPSATPPIMGSSFRHRRLVIAGHVVHDPIALARPAMRPAEIAHLTGLLARTRRMLEFGAGGSTTLALKMGVSHLVSVESDSSWIDRIHADDAAARARMDGRLSILHADIGAVGFMGAPTGDGIRDRWPDYARLPWSQADARQLDLVLIDGRFRVACILETALRVERQTLITVHDFWNRPAYHAVLPFLDEIDRCQTLGVFRAKPDLDRDAANALLTLAAYWPS
jgi:hypothetical protein